MFESYTHRAGSQQLKVCVKPVGKNTVLAPKGISFTQIAVNGENST